MFWNPNIFFLNKLMTWQLCDIMGAQLTVGSSDAGTLWANKAWGGGGGGGASHWSQTVAAPPPPLPQTFVSSERSGANDWKCLQKLTKKTKFLEKYEFPLHVYIKVKYACWR